VNVSCAMITLTLSIVCATSGATLPAGGPHRITFGAGELTTGSEIASSSTGLKIKTSAELVSAGATSLAILQGQVHGVSMMMSDRDRVSLKNTSSVTTFSFATQSDLAQGGAITINLPANYFTQKTAPVGVLVAHSGTASLSSCTMTSVVLSIVCTTSGGTLPAGGPHNITFGAGELATGLPFESRGFGLTVVTTVDLVSAGATSIAILQGQVHGVSMMMSDRDRVSLKNTSSVTTFSFATQSDLAQGGAITINLPANYFTQKTAPVGVLVAHSGTASLSSCTMTSVVLSIVCTTSGGTLPAGGPHNITFGAGELTTGLYRVVNFTGLSIGTSIELTSMSGASFSYRCQGLQRQNDNA